MNAIKVNHNRNFRSVSVPAKYRAATRDVTSVMKSLRAKQHGLPMEREHFRCCMSVKALVNATMIAGGRKESTTNDLKVQQADFGSCLASYFR